MRIARIGIGFAVAILFAVLLVRNVDLVERRLVEESDNRFRRRSILNSVVLLDVA